MGHETVLKARDAAKGFEGLRTYVRKLITDRQENFVDDLIGQTFAVAANETPFH